MLRCLYGWGMIRIPAAVAFAVALAIAVTACAAESSDVSGEHEVIDPRTATGTLISADGQTTGRVEVEIENVTDGFGETSPLATVQFFDLTTPYSHVTPGGSLAPRGDDPCFDTGIRSAGGSIVPAQDGTATAVMPAEAEGNLLYEIVLHLDWTQVDAEIEPCMQPVVARARLTWDD